MMIDKFDIVAENYVDDYKELAKEIYKAGLKRGRSKAKKITWIPCSERLPEINKVVLITNEQGNVSYGQFRGTYGDYWHWRKNTLAKVTAWMPLPKPYKAD